MANGPSRRQQLLLIFIGQGAAHWRSTGSTPEQPDGSETIKTHAKSKSQLASTSDSRQSSVSVWMSTQNTKTNVNCFFSLDFGRTFEDNWRPHINLWLWPAIDLWYLLRRHATSHRPPAQRRNSFYGFKADFASFLFCFCYGHSLYGYGQGRLPWTLCHRLIITPRIWFESSSSSINLSNENFTPFSYVNKHLIKAGRAKKSAERCNKIEVGAVDAYAWSELWFVNLILA